MTAGGTTSGQQTTGGTVAGGTEAGGTDSGATGGSTGGNVPSPPPGSDDWDASESDTGPAPGGAWADGMYVSGTNFNYISTLRLRRGATSVYTGAYVSSVDLEIGGEVDSRFNVPINQALVDSGNGLYVLPIPLRFASTRFNDAATINLNATFNYQLQDDQGNHTPTRQAKLKTFHVVAYNKGLAWLTKQAALSAYTTMLSPPVAYYNWDSPRAIDGLDGAADQLGKMRHSLVTGGTVLKGNEILAGLKNATAVLAYTHGQSDAVFLASWGDYGTAEGSTDFRALAFASGVGSEVGKAVRGVPPNAPPRSAPPINMAILHACSIGASGHNLAWALGIEDQGTNAPGIDRACAGFPDTVYSQLAGQSYPSDEIDPRTNQPFPDDPSKPYLSDHAKLLYSLLAQGKTIEQARREAYKKWKPSRKVNGTRQEMDMLIKGDYKTRLISVYTGQSTYFDPDADPTNPLLIQHPNYYPYRRYLVNP